MCLQCLTVLSLVTQWILSWKQQRAKDFGHSCFDPCHVGPQQLLPHGTLEDLDHFPVLDVVRYHRLFHLTLSFGFNFILRHMHAKLQLPRVASNPLEAWSFNGYQVLSMFLPSYIAQLLCAYSSRLGAPCVGTPS